ncbi:hypothetical protein JMM63_04405 [Rhodovulum sulfidophilum]|uniref:KAP family P-loop NTPase fold protein n=1 Tax=Rhodovulum sulfidophilum TaxID=35806 RepID=UPI001920B349|nr:P-loop NTPase fold protein [Rhodovulum sulfidophilum]MBL3594816.1 hypothetical protein [Rhodovulum sulfidophilum]
MKLFPQDSDVTLYETAFGEDSLGRRELSRQLSELVEKIEDPIVLALDDKWGSGKTYFLKRWVAAHTKENEGIATTVYFDAFENDYSSDPLVSLISTIIDRLPKSKANKIANLKEAGKKLIKPTLGLALSMITLGAKQSLDEFGDAIADATADEARSVARDIWDDERAKRDAIRDFKKLLGEITKENNTALVVVVDELDRCRPDYALSVLEIIKHFFSVTKVHFILGTNGEALENIVRARYGAGIDAERYLRKFVTATFSLPRNDGCQNGQIVTIKYAREMSAKMEVPEHISNRCMQLMEFVSRDNGVSLRDVGNILSRLALIPDTKQRFQHQLGYCDVLCVLVVSAVVDPVFHRDFLSGSLREERVKAFLKTSDLELSPTIEDADNQHYNRDAAVWFSVIMYCCRDAIVGTKEDNPLMVAGVHGHFGDTIYRKERGDIPSFLQRKYVDIFKL